MNKVTGHSISIKISIVIIVFVTLLSAVHYLLNVKQLKVDAFNEKIANTQRTMSGLQSNLQYLMANKAHNQLQKTITELGGMEDLKVAYLLDDQNRIVAATRISNVGKLLSEVEDGSVDLLRQIKSAKSHGKSRIWRSEDNQALYALMRVTVGKSSPYSLRSDKIGVLYLQVDMSWVEPRSHYLLQQSVLPMLALTFVAALLIVAYFHWLIGRRLTTLNSTVRNLVASDLKSRVEVSGNDEITDLARAFNVMTEQVQQQYRQLSEQKQRLSNTQALSHIGSWELDIDLQQLTWSEEVFRIFGYAVDESDKSFSKLTERLHPQDRDKVLESFKASLLDDSGTFEIEHRIIQQDSAQVRYVYQRCIHFKDDGSQRYTHSTGMVQDITERYLTKKALLDKESEQRQILDFMADAIITIDERGVIHSFNQSAEKLFGYDTEWILGHKINLLMPPADSTQHDQYLDKFIQTGHTRIIGQGREVVGRRKNGMDFPMRLSVVELPAGFGEPRRFIGSCVDLSKSKEQEEQLRRSQKMDALGKLTGGIAHDFNNMLGVILGYSHLLKEQLTDQPSRQKYAEQIAHAGERGAKLTQKLLSFSKRKPSRQITADLNQLIETDIDMLRKTVTARVTLIFNPGKALWPVKLDDGAFEDMLLNMSINAMHAIEGNGHLTLTTGNETLESAETITLDIVPGDYVFLSIEDDGCGMSSDVRSKIFDPFYTTKGTGGTGLGLSQIYGFMRSTGGAIQVHSEPGLGARFVLYFPRCIEAQTTGGAVNELAKMDTGGEETLLVVDDEPPLCAMAKCILTAKGYRVLTATSASQALALLAEHPVDLVLSDIIMPETNGYQLLKQIRQLYPAVSVRLISGFQGTDETPDSQIELDEPVIKKPYHADELLVALRLQLNKRKLADTSLLEDDNQPLICWSDKMRIDNGGPLDQDHKKLLDILNSCQQLEDDDSYEAPLKVLLQQLEEYTRYHFSREEAVMKACHYPHFDNHQRVHQMLLDKFEFMVNNKTCDQLRQWIHGFLTDWLIEHIMVMDQAVLPYIDQRREAVQQALAAFDSQTPDCVADVTYTGET